MDRGKLKRKKRNDAEMTFTSVTQKSLWATARPTTHTAWKTHAQTVFSFFIFFFKVEDFTSWNTYGRFSFLSLEGKGGMWKNIKSLSCWQQTGKQGNDLPWVTSPRSGVTNPEKTRKRGKRIRGRRNRLKSYTETLLFKVNISLNQHWCENFLSSMKTSVMYMDCAWSHAWQCRSQKT